MLDKFFLHFVSILLVGSSTYYIHFKIGGKQMLGLIPLLINADSRETITDLLKEQTETQWENFFNAINNSDMRDKFLIKIATYIEYLWSGVLLNDMKLMMANAFLLTQNLPPITPRRLLPSIVELVGKSVKVGNIFNSIIDHSK